MSFLVVPVWARTMATTVVAVRVPGGILVLADSKASEPGRDGSKPMCKVIAVKSAYVAATGLVRDAAGQYDAEAIASRAFDSPGRFETHVRQAMEQIGTEATKELLRLKAEDQKQYVAALKNGGNVVDVLFLAFENHLAMLAERGLRWNEAKSKLELREKHDCPGRDCPDGKYLSKIGEVSEIEKFLSAHRGANLDEATLQDLMIQQTKATPDEAGLPIQVLSIQESGPIWLANDLGCRIEDKGGTVAKEP